jgi:hypothetical protein
MLKSQVQEEAKEGRQTAYDHTNIIILQYNVSIHLHIFALRLKLRK